MSDRKSMGALWEKQSSKGTYFSGTIDLSKVETSPDGKYFIVVFKNDYKKGNQPDYRIFLQEARRNESAGPVGGDPGEEVPF